MAASFCGTSNDTCGERSAQESLDTPLHQSARGKVKAGHPAALELSSALALDADRLLLVVVDRAAVDQRLAALADQHPGKAVACHLALLQGRAPAVQYRDARLGAVVNP